MTPVLFVSHGAPDAALAHESPYAAALLRFAAETVPKAVVVVSAHWQTRPDVVRVTGAAQPSLIYDFSGFPDELYRLQYPAPGAPELAREIVAALAGAHVVDGAPRFDVALDEQRGWDHGVWVPLRLMLPAANVPVVQVSLPMAAPAALLALGRALAFVRAQGALLVGSGGAVHNLGALGGAATPAWAQAFDAWVADAVACHDLDALAKWRGEAPSATRAMPTSEHFDPLLVAVGATGPAEPVRTLVEGFAYGSLSLRSFAIG